jgi:hypothetical protein
MTDHPVDTCANSEWLAVHKYTTLEQAPQLGVDEQGLYLESPSLKYGGEILGLDINKTTNARAHIDLLRCPTGELCMKVKDMKTANGELEKLMTQAQLNAMLDGVSIAMPYGLDIKKVDAGGGAITIYGNFR